MSTFETTQPTLQVQGVTVPKLGFGTWQMEGPDATEAVRHALELGYRHIDTARAYGNEAEVGAGLVASGLPREEYFLTTKLWTSEFEPSRVRSATEDSLRRLGVDHVDLLLLHWPNADVPLADTLRALDAVRSDGLSRLIGVSNFPSALLREALDVAPVATDQVELHPFLAQDALLALRSDDLFITAYSPLAHGKVPRDETLRSIGAEHGKSAGQVALRWLLDLPGVAVIPKASTADRRAENLDVFDFSLTDADRERIAGLPKDRREIDPGFAPDWDR